MDNSYFKEAKPSIDKEQKKEAAVFRLIRAAETCNHFKTWGCSIRSRGYVNHQQISQQGSGQSSERQG